MVYRWVTLSLVAATVLGVGALAPAKQADRAPKARKAAVKVAAPAAPAPKPEPKRPAVRIAAMETDAGGFLDGEQLPFCTTDAIRGVAETRDADGLSLRWTATTSEGRVKPLKTWAGGKKFQFGLRDVPEWEDLYSPRTPLGVEVTVALVDPAGKTVASDTRSAWQSDLGQLRQEYVDHPLNPQTGLPRVPDVTAFRQMSPDGQWNDGDYEWALVPDWALEVNNDVQQSAAAGGLFLSSGLVRVTSVFRNPVRHWNLYLDLGRRPTTGSRHMWGAAIDFGVGDMDGDTRHQTWSDYGLVKELCDGHGMVVPEGRTDHVHLQWMPGS